MNLIRPSVTVDSATTTVSGTTAPNATVEIAVTGTALGATSPTTTITTVTAGPTGSFSSPVSLETGSNSVEVAVTAGGATNEAIFTVTNLLVSGTDVLCVPAATGGGNGPGYSPYTASTGVYAYPTNSAFAPDSLRLGDVVTPATPGTSCNAGPDALVVIDSGGTVSFQIGIQNMVSTFGSLDGAQMFLLYIHAPSGSVPAGELQSTAAASPFNYSIASADAWNQVIEVDGFGTDCWETPATTTSGLNYSYPSCGGGLGTPQVSAAQLTPSGGQTPGLVTITVPASTLGAPSVNTVSAWAGWTFTLAVAGQNGYGYDNARQFVPVPADDPTGGYSFAVCTAAEAALVPEPTICTSGFEQVSGGYVTNVPYVMDTIPPAGVNVQQELDPTVGSVVLQGVTVP
jgi:glucoamylase